MAAATEHGSSAQTATSGALNMIEVTSEVPVYTRDLKFLHDQPKQVARTPKRKAAAEEAKKGSALALPPILPERINGDALKFHVERARRHLAEAYTREEEELDEMLRRTDTEHKEFVRDLDTYFEVHDIARCQGKQQLHREWHEKVYSVIQGQVNAQLAQLSSRELNKRRNELMEAYLSTSNQKPRGMFRDIIIPSEYDPLAVRDMVIKYSSSSIVDPLKPEAMISPRSALTFSRRKAESPSVRPMLNVTQWGKLDATPCRDFSPRKRSDMVFASNPASRPSLHGLFDDYGHTPTYPTTM